MTDEESENSKDKIESGTNSHLLEKIREMVAGYFKDAKVRESLVEIENEDIKNKES